MSQIKFSWLSVGFAVYLSSVPVFLIKRDETESTCLNLLLMALIIYAKTALMKLCCVKPDSGLSDEQISQSWMICSYPALASFCLTIPITILALPWVAIGGAMSGHSSDSPDGVDPISALALQLPLWFVPIVNLIAIPACCGSLLAKGLLRSAWSPISAFFAVTFIEYFIVFSVFLFWTSGSHNGESERPAWLNSQVRYGLIDRSGTLIIPMKYKHLNDMHGGLAAFEDDFDRWGYIDSTGKEVIKAQFSEAGDFSQGKARVVKSVLFAKQAGTIDREGKFTEAESTPAKASVLPPAVSYLKPLQSEGKWGFVDSYGKFVVHPAFESVKSFEQGTAAVKVNGRWGIVDEEGLMVIPASFRDASSFHEGVAVVAL